jgi:tetratricopeptide (TPR) repeat protein
MPYKIRTTPKKPMLDPEAIVSRSEAVLDRLRKHRVGVGLVVGILLAGGLTWGGIIWFQAKQDRAALLLEYEASKIALETPSEQEDLMARQEKASVLYQEILAKYPRSSSAPFAQFQLANRYFELHQYEKAAEAYQEFLRQYRGHETLVPMVHLRLGYAHLFREDYQAALSDFQRVIEDPNAWNRDQALYEAGRVLEGLDEREAAIQKYEGLIKEFPRSPWAGEAQSRLKALGVFETDEPASGEESVPEAKPSDQPDDLEKNP